MPIIPPPDEDAEPVASNVQLPKARWEALDEIADYETQRRGKTFSRTKVVDHLLKWAVEQYWAEEGGKPAHTEKKSKR